MTAIATLFGRFQWFQVVLTVAALILVAVLKFLYWRAIDAAPRSHTIEAATGLGRIGTVSQWELPHTATNFIQKEMGYAVARKHAEKLRRLVFFLLAAALIVLLASLAAPVISLLAAALTLAAAVVERWLFFAQAQHVVSLYYGAKAA